MSAPFCTHGWIEGDCPYCKVAKLELQIREVEDAWAKYNFGEYEIPQLLVVLMNAFPNIKPSDVPRNWADTHRAGDDDERPTEKRNDVAPAHPRFCAKCHRADASVTTATFNNKGEFRGKLLCHKCDVSESLD